MDADTLAFLTAQQAAVNACSVADFVGNVQRFRQRAAQPPAADRQRRLDALRTARIDVLSRLLDAEAAAQLADRELAEASALVRDDVEAGHWPDDSPFLGVAAQVAARAQALPPGAAQVVQVNVALIPGRQP